jgi:hypothetical protein
MQGNINLLFDSNSKAMLNSNFEEALHIFLRFVLRDFYIRLLRHKSTSLSLDLSGSDHCSVSGGALLVLVRKCQNQISPCFRLAW